MAMMDNAEESDVNNRRCERSYGPRTLWRVAEDSDGAMATGLAPDFGTAWIICVR
jgi:hypothetical protein